jgi:hypothetical protein
MPKRQLISVIGATGTQGGAVARALLADGSFAVRGVTRDATSAKAQALAGLGAEVVEATLEDQDSLRKTFHGAYGARTWSPRSGSTAPPSASSPRYGTSSPQPETRVSGTCCGPRSRTRAPSSPPTACPSSATATHPPRV